MTIRDKLSRDVRRNLLLSLFALLLFFFGVALMANYKNAFPWAIIPGFILFVVLSVCKFRWGKCPICQNPLGYFAAYIGGRLLRIGEKMRFCPYCGVDIDSEIENDVPTTPPSTTS